MTEADVPRQQLRHIQITGGERNVGIIRLAFRQLLGTEEQYEVLTGGEKFFSATR